MASTTTTRRRAAAKPAPEPVEDDFEDLDETEDAEEPEDADEDLEELDESDEDTDEAETKPKAKRTPPVRPKIEFGSPELAAHVTEVTGENYDSRAIRMLLRKLAKDGKLSRVVGEDRGRYEFSGPNDPTVKLVVKMITSGEAKKLKQEGLQKVKDAAAVKKAAKAAAKAAEAEDADDDMEEVEDEAPAPKPRTRRAATPAKPAAPAKAAPATRRRTTSAK